MGFFAATPADQPLVIDGLGSSGKANDVWGRLFTDQPERVVFTHRIEDVSPYMQSQLTADNYDERFLLLVQMRFATPQKLDQPDTQQPEWASSNQLQIPLEPRRIEDPAEDFRTASSVVATTLLIYKYESRFPDSVALPVHGDTGDTIAKIVAQ